MIDRAVRPPRHGHRRPYAELTEKRCASRSTPPPSPPNIVAPSKWCSWTSPASTKSDNEQWLQRSINLRNLYVDPLNYIQVALIQQLRSHHRLKANSDTRFCYQNGSQVAEYRVTPPERTPTRVCSTFVHRRSDHRHRRRHY
ncbi:MAG: phosphoenolpyruvate carboxylase [Caldilineaceae bacterium]